MKATERTYYPYISKFLNEMGFKSIQEIKSDKGYLDIECIYDSLKFIIEIKIEDPKTKWKKLFEGIAQAWRYSKSLNAQGFIVIEYPAEVRSPISFEPNVLETIALESKCNVVVLTDFWTDKFPEKIKVKELFEEFKKKLDNYLRNKEKSISLDLAIDTIRDAIISISSILRDFFGTSINDLINTVVGRFDLFLALSERKEEEIRPVAIDLASYLLVNQILFYHVYSSLTKKVPVLDEEKINSVYDLKEYFDKIININYKAVYSVDIVSKLPDVKTIVDEIKKVIEAVKGVRVESIRHDLIGRVYHESLPFETRKILATFYTKPVAGEILAGLCIDKWNETILDPACGSGTLLVSAYRRKSKLYEKEIGRKFSIKEEESLHHVFIQEQISGIDIMPFASHLAAVNLSSLNPKITTDKVRIACYDSLTLQDALKSKKFRCYGIELKPFSKIIQVTLDKSTRVKQLYFTLNGKIVESKGAISPEGIGEEFLLKPVDTVIMNPPFTDREKMPRDYREKLKMLDKLTEKCGSQINLWGYFLALADDLIKDGGKIGAVIPINIARGKATEKIRNYILNNYHIRYIVKTTKDLGFSESAAFRDILLIIEKRKPRDDDLTGIVFLKKSLSEISLEDAEEIVEKIREIRPKVGLVYSNDNFEMYFVSYRDILANRENLMPFIWSSRVSTVLTFERFLSLIKERAKDKLVKIKKEQLMDGFHTSPKGLSEIVYITRPIDKSRISRAFLILEKEGKNFIKLILDLEWRSLKLSLV